MTDIVFSRPALPDLIARVNAQLGTNLPGLTPQLRRSTIAALSIVLGQELLQLYAYIDNFAGWFFVGTAEGIYLDRKGDPLGVPRLPGGYASGTAAFTGLSSGGPYIISAGSILTDPTTGMAYTLTASVTLVAGAGSGAITCTAMGSAGTLVPGANLTLAKAVAGVNANATVSVVGAAGVDVESDDAYRVRILARMQKTPQSGAGNDYVAWAKTVPGVTRVFVWPLDYSGTDAGQVTVAPLFDGRANPIPLVGDIGNVAAAIIPVKPVTATVNVVALTADAIAVTIQGLTVLPGFVLATVQANIQASLAGLFASTTAGGASFGDGLTWGTVGGDMGLDDIYDAIKQSAGVNEFVLAAPTAGIFSSTGHIAVLGAVSFT